MPTNPIIDAISDIPLLRPFVCASDGAGDPAPEQAKHRAPGWVWPSGWWIVPMLMLGMGVWFVLWHWRAGWLQ